MILDANKTDLTIRITGAACLFLSERGFKPVETEVTACGGWVADVAGVCVPCTSETIKLKLAKRFTKRWENHDSYHAAHKLWKEQIASVPSPLTAIAEVKTSRADFLSDEKFLKPPVANLQYLAVPRGMLEQREYPSGWGILLCNPDGRLAKYEIAPAVNDMAPSNQMWLILEIAMRRHNATSFTRTREFFRAIRRHRTEEKAKTRLREIIWAIKSVVSGEESIDSALVGWKEFRDSTEYVKKELRELIELFATKRN